MKKRNKLTTNNVINIFHLVVILFVLVWLIVSIYKYGLKLDFNTKLLIVILVNISIISNIFTFLNNFLALKKKKKMERKTEAKLILETVLDIKGRLDMEKNYEEILNKLDSAYIRGDILKLVMIMSTGYRISNITIGSGVNIYKMYVTLDTLDSMDCIYVYINIYDLINFLNYKER